LLALFYAQRRDTGSEVTTCPLNRSPGFVRNERAADVNTNCVLIASVKSKYRSPGRQARPRALSSAAHWFPRCKGASNEALKRRIDPIATAARVRRIGPSLRYVREGDRR
jgi:hypothetical protein